ncbi:MAG: CusA/CzcA family heavy metal efflux RND transporter [Bacteroidota bacterium]
MLNNIIGFSIRNKLIIGLFVLALIGYGIYETTRLPIDAVPDITNNQVQVITVAPSFGATDIERLVTFPIEQANSNISGMKEIRSFSRFGLSLVTIVFDDETDIYWARQQVAERLQKVQNEIPKGIGQPELGPITTGLGEIYQYVLRPKNGYEGKYDETQLRTIQDWIVRRQLLGVEGVAEVSSMGGKLKQYEISVHPNKLQSYNVTINDVFAALEKNNQNTGGAYIERGPTVLFIRSEGLIGNTDDINQIVIKSTSNGTPIFIKDVADVNIGFATRYGAMTFNNKGEVAGAVVMMLKGANSSKVIKNVKERIEQIQKTLPEGVVIEPFLDRTKMVNNAIGTVEKNLAEGALIVVFILVLFLGNFRAGLLVASVIPLAMLFAIILMNTFGISGNLMSLGALDFGLIVDGAVIIVEAVMHGLSHNKKLMLQPELDQKSMDEQVRSSSGKMMNSAVFGQIIILIVYLPIFTLQGIEGKMFKPMAQTVAFALLGAFVLSITYIPMMSALVLSKKRKSGPNFSDKAMKRVEEVYQNALVKVLGYPKTVLTAVSTLFVLSIITLSFLGGEFIPALEEGDFAIETRVLTGSNLNTSIKACQDAAYILKNRFPEVEKVVSKIGSGEVPTDPMPMEASDLMVILKDKSEWTSAATFDELSEKMSEALKDVPGVTFGFQFPVQMRFNELMTGARQDVVCKIFGENLDTLARYASQLGKIVSTVKGSQDLFIEPITGMPQIIVSYNRAAIAQYNMNIEDINKVLNTAFAGQSSGLVFEGEKRFDLVVRLQNNQRKNLEDVQNLLIPGPQGTQIPLYQLADVSIKDGPNQIQREDAKRRIVVGFNIHGRDVQSIVNELQQKTNQKIKLPAGYYITYGGAFENLNEAKKRLMIAVPISLFLIFLLLFFAFKSIKQGLIIYTAIPLSATGGIFFLAMRGMPFSISAGIGFIALFGVSVLNGLVLIAEFNRLRKDGINDLKEIVITGTKLRLRPVLMTAFVASLGFLPMALSKGAGAEVQRPLATVVIGGLMIATFLTLFVLPILYIIFDKIEPKVMKIKKLNTVILCLIFSGIATITKAQNAITLEAAIDTALKNNLNIKSEELKVAYQKQLIRTSVNIAPTNIAGEFGQLNSSYSDNRLAMTQNLSFPTVYVRQRNLQKDDWKSSILHSSLKKAELKKLVNETFFTILCLQEKETLLTKNDSLYAEFARKAQLRFNKGESNILEKATAETQRGNIKMQLQQLKQEIELMLLQLQLLLNSNNRYIPVSTELKFNGTESAINTTEHPSLKLAEQKMEQSKTHTRLEKAKLLPDITMGYYNMSMIGNGADNILYKSNTRFQSAQIGLAIPLLGGTQNAKIKAAKINQGIEEQNYLQVKQNLEYERSSAEFRYKSNLENVAYLEQNSIPNIRLIYDAASKQFINGEINYLDWVILTNQAISIENSYIDAIRALNESAIQIQFLNQK